ncbi:MAG: DUF885 domain-containing protein [Candidatus Zixiibacteriota bacterium]
MAANEGLQQLFADHWNYQLERWPTSATYNGDHRFDDKLHDVSVEAFKQDEATIRSFLKRLELITSDADLSPDDQLNAELFERELKQELERLAMRDYLMPVSQQSGPQMVLPELLNVHPFDTEKGCEDFIARLRAFPRLINQTISNMQLGVTEKLVPARINVEKALPQFLSQVTDTVENHLLATAADRFGDSIPETRREQLRADLLAAIRDHVIPAYKRIAAYMQQDYLPQCRTEVGVHALPDGQVRYRSVARRYTTTDLTPEEISAIGKRELARVHEEMRAVMKQVGFDGTIPEFADSLRRDPRFYYSDPDSLVAGFKAILARMDERMPELFGRLPQASYGFREMEPYRAESAPDAYYYPAPEDRSRPAYFYINTYKPEMRPKYTMEALAYHEAVPGHHLQIALQQELENLPMFRQHGGYTAFVEGWALYSEALPKEVGFYKDPYSEFGRLTFDAWRCTRLIVDPGIHYFGWTRQQAIDFFRENTALSELNIQSEVDRYIAWPGQALAYKIGQLKIAELRKTAETELGADFDLRAFHDALLEEGALPLDILEAKMTRWIESQRATR